MKICNLCHKEYSEGRFCLECGGELKEQSPAQKKSGSGISMGDKNVVAGDIIGRKEEYKITGNTTFIKNEDETRKVINCNVCGENKLVTNSVRCPSCTSYVCKDHYNQKNRRCSHCEKNAENEYKSILEQVLLDGKIDQNERIILDARAKLFMISTERASEIENELKNQARSTIKNSLNTFDKIEFNKIKKEIASVKDLVPIFERIGRLYAKYPDNEEIKRRYYQIGPYAIGLSFKERLNTNFDDFYEEFAKIEIEILHNKDLRVAIDILDYVKEQFAERELDTQAKELDILYRFYETEGDDYIEPIEDLLKCIMTKNWNASDYASYILFKIFTDNKLVFQDEFLNQWKDNLPGLNSDDNILIQLYLKSLKTEAESNTEQNITELDKGDEYLYEIFKNCKEDGYFTKFESYDSFKKYFHDSESYKKLWTFLTSKDYKVLSFDQFIEKIRETTGIPSYDKKIIDSKDTQEVALLVYENEYLYKIFKKCKEDGYFSKYESYDSFKDYFHDDATYKKLWDFLVSKKYKVLPYQDFIEIINAKIKSLNLQPSNEIKKSIKNPKIKSIKNGQVFDAVEITYDDSEIDENIRPTNFKEFNGQETIVENLKSLISAAKRKKSLDHILFSGSPGLGKTTLATIIANELAVNLKVVLGSVLKLPGDLAGVLTNLEEGDILFFDEIHLLNTDVEEYLYSAMKEFTINIKIDKGQKARSVPLELNPFTLIGATTESSLLTSKLKARFGKEFHLEYYDTDILTKIVKRSAAILAIKIDDSTALEIARKSKGTPRIANALLRRESDYAKVEGNSIIDSRITEDTFETLNSDKKSLDHTLLYEPPDLEKTIKNADSHSSKKFKTVKIGNQVWMAENLDVDKFRNGDLIPHVQSSAEWTKFGENKMPAWCYYDNDSEMGELYGRLYNWFAVNDQRGLAPEGWHVPLVEEWKELVKYLGGFGKAGSLLKSKSGWNKKGNGTDTTGFSGLPGGWRFEDGLFDGEGDDASYWSTEETYDLEDDSDYDKMNYSDDEEPIMTDAYYYSLTDDNGKVDEDYRKKGRGFSVRCVKD